MDRTFIDQIEAAVDDAIPVYGETIIDDIQHSDWMNCEPYCHMKFRYKRAEFSFLSICDTIEMLGLDEELFSEQLRQLVEGIVLYRYEMYMKEKQEEYVHELNTTIERREAV